jgi:hypothetical protein
LRPWTPFSRFADDILGVVATFDRLIFKGHLNRLYPDGAVKRWLADQAALLKDLGRFAQRTTERITRHAEALAARHRRLFVYLQSVHTSKEAPAKESAERDGVREGLICVLCTLETCTSLDLHKNRQTCRLEGWASDRLVRPEACFRWTQAGADVDLLLIHGRRAPPVEIELAAVVPPRSPAGPRQCLSDLGLKRGFVVSTGEERRGVGSDIELMPWDSIRQGDVPLPL